MSTTINTSNNQLGWQIGLVCAGSCLIIGAAVLQVVISSFHSTTTVSHLPGGTTQTTTGPAAPPAALVTTCLGLGVILLIVGALYSRISKITLTGVGEIDLDTQAAIAAKAAQVTGGNPARTKQLVKRANEKLLVQQAVGHISPHIAASDDAISNLVQTAATELHF